MATLLDDEQQPEMELHDGETLGNIEEDTPVQVIEEEPSVVEEEPTEDTPDSKFPISHMKRWSQYCEERDRHIGQQGNELGNMRQTFEAMARTQSVPAQPEPEPVEEADFFVDPQKAVDSRIDNHPALKQAQDMAQKLAYAQGLATLQQRHPDLKEVVLAVMSLDNGLNLVLLASAATNMQINQVMLMKLMILLLLINS